MNQNNGSLSILLYTFILILLDVCRYLDQCMYVYCCGRNVVRGLQIIQYIIASRPTRRLLSMKTGRRSSSNDQACPRHDQRNYIIPRYGPDRESTFSLPGRADSLPHRLNALEVPTSIPLCIRPPEKLLFSSNLRDNHPGQTVPRTYFHGPRQYSSRSSERCVDTQLDSHFWGKPEYYY